MAQSILEITSTLKSTVVFDKTNAEVRQILEWFMQNENLSPPEGLTATELNQWKLDEAHRKVWRLVMAEVRSNRLGTTQEQAEQEARAAVLEARREALEQMRAETALLDEPAPPQVILPG